MVPSPSSRSRSGKRRLYVLAFSLVAAALGVFSLFATQQFSQAAGLLRSEEAVALEGPAEAPALSHLPVLAYDLDAFDVALEVHPHFGMKVAPDGTVRLLIQREHGRERGRVRVFAFAVPASTGRVALFDEDGRAFHEASAELSPSP